MPSNISMEEFLALESQHGNSESGNVISTDEFLNLQGSSNAEEKEPGITPQLQTDTEEDTQLKTGEQEVVEQEIEEDPYEDFYIKPDFFGELAADGGTKNKPSEEQAARELNEKLSGLGIKITEIKPGFNAIKVIGQGEEEDINLGMFKELLTAEDETPTEKADRLNNLIKKVIEIKKENNPLFDPDLYVSAMKKAKTDTPEVYSYSKDGGRFLTVDELNFEQLNEHTHRVHLNLMNDYWESEEGQENSQLISEQRAELERTLWQEAINKIIINGESIDSVVGQYINNLDNATNEIYENNNGFQKMLSNTGSVVGSLFNEKLLDKKYREGIEEEFGGFVASSDILTAFAKGTTVVFPKEVQEFKGIRTNATLSKLNEQLGELKGLSDDATATGSYFESGAPEVSFPLKNYKVSELKSKLLTAITHNEMKFIGNMLKAEQYKDKLDLLTKPNSQLFTQDGKLNITSDNWQLAIGDQAFRMMSSIFSGGMTTLIAEAGGAYSQILEGLAIQHHGEEKWASMDKHEKVKSYLDLIDSNATVSSPLGKKPAYEVAMGIGGINATLENVSNLFFVSKVAKPVVTNNIKGYFQLFMNGKIRKALTDIAKNTDVTDGLKVLGPTLVETVTETSQDIVTQYGVGTALDNYAHSWNETANSALTAAVTTPFLFGSGRAANVVYTEVSARIASIKNPKGIVTYVRNQKAAYLQEKTQGVISQQEYDNRMVQLDAAEKMFSETDKVVTDTEAVKMILEAQVEIEKQTARVRKLKADIAKAKKENPGYDEELDVMGQDELMVAIAKIQQQEKNKNIAKRKDSYRTQVRDAASDINSDPVKSKDFDAKVFKTTQEALDYLEREIGINLANNPNLETFIAGEANGITIDRDGMKNILGEDYTGKGIVIWSDEAIEYGIDQGDRFSANAIQHEGRHIDMYYKSDEELSMSRDAVLNILQNSKSPQMQEIRKMIYQRLLDYNKAYGRNWDNNSRLAIEEFFASISDVTSVLATDALTKEDRKTVLEIGAELGGFIDGTAFVEGDWNVDNTLEHLQSMPGGQRKINLTSQMHFDENGNIIRTIDTNDQIVENTKNSLREGRQSDLILLEDSNPYGKGRRSNEEIDIENKRLNELIKKNETYVHPDGDMEIQDRIRKEGGKKYRDLLFFNNYGKFKELLKIYDDQHPLHTDERKEYFIGEALKDFSYYLSIFNKDKQGNYQQKNDSFAAYYFGDPKDKSDKRSIAKLRVVKYWEDMQAEFTVRIEDMTGEDSFSDYDQNYVTDIQDKINDYNERSVLREGLSNVMEFEVDGDNYNKWISDQSELLKDYDFSRVFDPNASQDLRKLGMSLWKNLKKLTNGKDNKIFKGGQPTQFYIDLITENVETYYNQLDQKTFNDIFIEHTEVIIDEDTSPTGRLTVLGSKKAKGIKSKTAGNVKRKKKEFTPEIRDAILEQLLKTDEIAKLKAEGKTNAEIHKIIRMDMVQQSTLKNFSDILFKDAMQQIINSEEFKKDNGIAASEISQVALLIDKGIDAKFSLADGTTGEIDASIGSEKFMQEVNRLTRSIDNYTDHNEWEAVIDFIQADEFASQDIKDFVSSMYNKGLVESAGEKNFKTFTVANENIDEKLRSSFNDGGNIRFNSDARENMIKNAKIITDILGKEFVNASGLEFFGFKGGGRFLNNSAKVQRPGWKKGEPNQWLKNEDGSFVTGEHYAAYNDLVSGLKSIKEENLPDGITYEDLAAVRMMNTTAGTKETGIFKRLITILESDMTKAEKLAEIQESGLGAEIDAANKANTKVFKTIVKTIAEEVKKGTVDDVAILEMFKMQSNLVQGFRGMSRLDGYLVLNGSQKGTKWKGEHAKSMSEVNAQIADLIYRYKQNPEGVNLDTEIDLILAEYSQILGESEVFDVLDIPGKTNVAGINRLGYLSDDMLKGITNHNGENARDIQGRLYAQRVVKEDIIKSQKKAEAIENINLKTTSGEIQGATVMDFDETVGVSENYIIATKDGKKVKIASADWPNVGEGMIKEGWTMDFSDFNKVTDGKPGPLFDKLKNQIDKYGVKNVHILTARATESAPAIQAWLKSQGINLPLENITGLGNSTGQAKADWIENNLILNGFNDIYFVDDAHQNVDAVQEMFNEYPSGLLVDGGKSVLVDPTKFSLSDTFNKILQDTEGVEAKKVFSKAQGEIRGRTAGKWYDILYSPSAYDFEMFTYKYMGKGELGEQQALFFKNSLFDPYEQAIQQIDKQKQKIRDDFKALVKELPQVKKNLKKNIEGTNYTFEQAIRVYTWAKNNIDIPGLSKRDKQVLIKAVEADQELIMFSDRLSAISRQKEGYVAPTEYWTVEGLSYDLTESVGKVSRAKALAQWKENKDQIFSEENKNKLRAIYGNDHVEALEDMLYRMETGRNKKRPGRIEQQWNNWVNNSVGAVMFFNMRSASLQTISAFNYIDWDNNNVARAAMAFANQPQYWKDFSYIFNSDYLKERRAGNKRTINEAELAAHLKGKDNKAKAALAWLLEKGFKPTQIADSFAIASGGASFYRNQIKFYEKQGMSTKEAEAQAFMDFRDKTEKGQQSSRADMISQQQAGGLGRLILAFKNTPMQYNRLIIKAIADLKNKRGDTKTNLSKIAYYGAVQNVIFNSLQTALFSALGDEDEWDKKTEYIANGMIDSILGGMGLSGAVAMTIKNGYLEYTKQKKRGFQGDQTRTIIQFANMSPTIGSKLRKLYSGIQTEQFNKGAIEEMGWNINNPAFNSLANVVSATTNIPLDRAVTKIQNILLASKDETEASDKIALLLGWNPWNLGLEPESRKINKEVKERKSKERKAEKAKIRKEKKEQEAIKIEKENKEKQEQEKKEGKKDIKCAAVNKSGKRCNNVVEPGSSYCTIHAKVEQRKDGKQSQCKKIKSDGKRCKMQTTSKSGFCYYHD